ncbi:hypothetical protein B0H10DRAFT_1977804 [Mycena sp. CBHHK59/15]|nr:hypothetical protein B0H10DRAFT_1977804 [Mycena sp. CBHHK59/15]
MAGSSLLSPFDLVSRNLRAIGSLTIHEYLSLGPSKLASIDITHEHPSTVSLPHKNAPNDERPAADSAQNVARLHHTCQRAFGNSSGLKFEFLDDGVDKKQCILTVIRPNGVARTYKTEPIFRRKNDAKAQAATIAIQHGVLDFIAHGDSAALKGKKGVLLVPLDKNDAQQPVASTSKLSSNSRIKELEICCRDWRGAASRPLWTDFDDPKIWNKHGTALRIQLAPHCYRVYSCDPTFDSPSKAREYCANLAVDEGVLDFIQHGNGQKEPQSDISSLPGLVHSQQATSPRSLKAFNDSLPRPFEEPDKTVAEINAPHWLSNLLAACKGGRFSADFYPLAAVSGAATPLQGCLLRLKRPGECRSYLVDPQFSAQRDARCAVSLLALSQGAGKYIREIGAAVEAKVTPEMRGFTLKVVFPTLAAEAQRIGGGAPHFEYTTTEDAHGCKLLVHLTSKGDDIREYVIPTEYRSKGDAKVAVAYLAAERGIIDLLRFDGQPIPPGQYPAFTFHEGVPQVPPKQKKKRKQRNKDDAPDCPQPKKPKTAYDADVVAVEMPRFLPQKPPITDAFPSTISSHQPNRHLPPGLPHARATQYEASQISVQGNRQGATAPSRQPGDADNARGPSLKRGRSADLEDGELSE